MPTSARSPASGDALFAVDSSGNITLWNEAAESLFGYRTGEVLDRPCHEVVRGSDVFGNRYCSGHCPLLTLAERGEPIHGFELSIPRGASETLRARITVIVTGGGNPGGHSILHVVQPLQGAGASLPCSLLGEFLGQSALLPPDAGQNAKLRNLTPREQEILRILAEGANSADIADQLCISVATVRNHVQNILQKLHVHSRLQAVCVLLADQGNDTAGTAEAAEDAEEEDPSARDA